MILNTAYNITQFYIDITILLNITWTLQYYSILHSILGCIEFIILNITYNITQYYMPNHTMLLYIACILGSIQYNIPQYLFGFINIIQYYM